MVTTLTFLLSFWGNPVKRIKTIILLVVTFLGIGVYLGRFTIADIYTWLTKAAQVAAEHLPDREIQSGPVPNRGDSVRVASFNIQVLGQSKMEKPKVVEMLATILAQYDVIAIQELRSKEQDVIPRLVSAVNAKGYKYDYIVGPPLGNTSSTEQYVFLFDTARIKLVPQSVYTLLDPANALHREPLVATFEVANLPATSVSAGQPFRFTLVNLHTDPDVVKEELSVLDDVVAAIHASRFDDDIIVLGDFNADNKQINSWGQMPQATCAIQGQPTNTREKSSYDNLVFDLRLTSEFTNKAGVHNFRKQFNLSLDQALEISDHFPVWAEFSPTEKPAGVMASGEVPFTR
jgi:deoxyribonuclease-1-like protein